MGQVPPEDSRITDPSLKQEFVSFFAPPWLKMATVALVGFVTIVVAVPRIQQALGPPPVPNVVGEWEEIAKPDLEFWGYLVVVRYENPDDCSPGKVTRQDPLPDTLIDFDSDMLAVIHVCLPGTTVAQDTVPVQAGPREEPEPLQPVVEPDEAPPSEPEPPPSAEEPPTPTFTPTSTPTFTPTASPTHTSSSTPQSPTPTWTPTKTATPVPYSGCDGGTFTYQGGFYISVSTFCGPPGKTVGLSGTGFFEGRLGVYLVACDPTAYRLGDSIPVQGGWSMTRIIWPGTCQGQHEFFVQLIEFGNTIRTFALGDFRVEGGAIPAPTSTPVPPAATPTPVPPTSTPAGFVCLGYNGMPAAPVLGSHWNPPSWDCRLDLNPPKETWNYPANERVDIEAEMISIESYLIQEGWSCPGVWPDMNSCTRAGYHINILIWMGGGSSDLIATLTPS